jgi:hypothetical protein
VPIAMYIIFVAVGVFAASVLGHSLSALEEKPPTSRRCRKAHNIHRRRRLIRWQRVRCRIEA